MPDTKSPSRIFPHFSRGRFNNYLNEASEDCLWRSAIMYLQSLFVRHNDAKIIRKWFAPSKIAIRSHIPRITWLGHSTFLIQIANKNILTDPLFGGLTILFPRILPAGMSLRELPSIDYVLISHNHRDHMDSWSLNELKKLFPTLQILVPKGDKKWFDRRGFAQVSEHMWWDRIELPGVTFTFLPAFHWSQRGLFDRNKSLWGSWMIEAEGFCSYFAGDTAYADHFMRIAHYFPRIDTALMPIGPCEPRLWMKRSHIDAEEAGQAFLDLKATHLLPMHWGTFHFGIDKFLGPVERLRSWWKRKRKLLATQHLKLQKIGEAAIFHPQFMPSRKQKVVQS